MHSINKISCDNGKVFVIAEIGTAHGGNIAKAFDLIASAVDSGADCIKFQHVYADEIIHPSTGLVPLPSGSKSLYSCFKAVETGIDFMAALKNEVERLGAVFLCTPFGIKSARELKALNVDIIKVASPELNYTQLLQEVASYKLPTIISSGVSKLADIEEALAFFRNADVTLLHCVTSYPAPEKDFNLKLMNNLSAIFDVPVGLSDHSLDPCFIPSLATALGAVIIEKHFCLSNDDGGLDDPIALTPQNFAFMVKSIREISAIRITEGQPSAINAVRSKFGRDRLQKALGNGKKHLAKSEEANYMRTNRSIHATKTIQIGETLSAQNTAIFRTEKVLRPGLKPKFMSVIYGKKAIRTIQDGEGIVWEDVL